MDSVQTIQDQFAALLPLVEIGLFIGITVGVIVAVAKIGFKLAPYVIVAAFLAYLFS